jgi:hypothetical protein
LSRIRLAVDNERAPRPSTPPQEEPSSRPLPWGVCLLIWAGVALAAWAAIALVLYLI